MLIWIFIWTLLWILSFEYYCKSQLLNYCCEYYHKHKFGHFYLRKQAMPKQETKTWLERPWIFFRKSDIAHKILSSMVSWVAKSFLKNLASRDPLLHAYCMFPKYWYWYARCRKFEISCMWSSLIVTFVFSHFDYVP